MKTLRCVSSAVVLLLVLSSLSYADDREWGGTWVGMGEQNNGTTWGIRLTVEPDKFRDELFGFISYPSLGCSARLDLLGRYRGGIEAVTTENLVTGQGYCIDKGTIVFTYDKKLDRISYQWRMEGTADSAFAVLERSSAVANRMLDAARENLGGAMTSGGYVAWAEAMAKAGRRSEIRSGVAYLKSHPPKNDLATHYNALASIYGWAGDTAEALRSLERAVSSAEQMRDPNARARMFGTLMRTAAALKSSSMLSSIEMRLEKLSAELSNDSIVLARTSAARAWHEFGDVRKARAILDAEAEKQKLSASFERVMYLSWIGEAYCELGYPERGTDIMDHAYMELDVIYGPGDEISRTIMEALMSIIYMNSADPSRAIARARADMGGKPSALSLLAVARRLAEKGMRADALAIAEEGLEATGDGDYRVSRLIAAAALFAVCGENRRAGELFMEAERLIDASNDDGGFMRANHYKALAVIAARLGDMYVVRNYVALLDDPYRRLTALIEASEIVR